MHATSACTSGQIQTEWRPTRQPGLACKLQRHQLRRAAAAGAGAGAAVARRPQRHVAAAAAAADQLNRGEPAAEDEVEEYDPEDWVEVGVIGAPHGVRGEMKVQALTDFPQDRLATPGTRWLQAPAPKIGRRQAEPPEEVQLEWGRSSISKGNEVWLVKLEDVESPEEAALLRGFMLLIPASAREPLEDEDEFYVQELVGLQVFLQSTGAEVGHVTDVFDGTGTHDVMRIQLSRTALQQLAASQAQGQEQEGEEDELEEEEKAARQQQAVAAAAGNGSGGGGARHVLLPFAKAMVPVVDLKARRMEITPPEGLLELAAPSNMRRQRRENRGKRDRRRTRPKGQSAADADSGSGGQQGAAAAAAPAAGSAAE